MSSAVSPSPSANVQALVEASERANTRVSYAAAIRHFEQQWHGLLPATEGAVAQYLADHAASHSVATLRQRLAALSRWHSDFGFPDPTKSPLVRKVLRGIRATQVQVPRQAKALGMATLEQLDAWLLNALVQARSQGVDTSVSSAAVVPNTAAAWRMRPLGPPSRSARPISNKVSTA